MNKAILKADISNLPEPRPGDRFTLGQNISRMNLEGITKAQLSSWSRSGQANYVLLI